MAQYQINTIAELLQNPEMQKKIVNFLPGILAFGDWLADWAKTNNNLFLKSSELKEYWNFEDFATKINPQLRKQIKNFDDFCLNLVNQFGNLYYDFWLSIKQLIKHQDILTAAQTQYNNLINDPKTAAEVLTNQHLQIENYKNEVQQAQDHFKASHQAIINHYAKITKEMILKYDQTRKTR